MSKKRASNEQLEWLVSQLEKTPALATSRHQGQHGRRQNQDSWAALASFLNAIGTGTTKPGEKWQQAWKDLRNNVKRKVSHLTAERIKTGGGPSTAAALTPLEERVLAILGSEMVQGVESGDETVPPSMNPMEIHVEIMNVEDEEAMVEDSPSLHSPVASSSSTGKRPSIAETVNVPPKKKTLSIEERFLLLDESRAKIEERRVGIEERRVEIDLRRVQLDEWRQISEDKRQVTEEKRLVIEERKCAAIELLAKSLKNK